MRRLRLGVDAANLLHDQRGIGRYVRSLLRHWLERRADSVALTLLVPHVLVAPVARRLAENLQWPHVRVARRHDRGAAPFDVIWYPWNGVTWTAPGVKVATVHDVWPFASPSADPRIRGNEQRPFLTTARLAQRIITDSHFSKWEIVGHLAVDPARIDVIYPGVAERTPSVVPASFPGIARYVLFVGETEGRKDLRTLIAAMRLLPEVLRRDTALVIAGKAVQTRETAGAVRTIVTGQVSDQRLASLYAGAAVFAFPSRYEGFGLPVLEAMRYGTPVVASSAASIPEAGGNAALYFFPGDSARLAALLTQVLGDARLAARLADAGRRRAGQMSWHNCADQTLAVMERALNDSLRAA